MKSKHFVGVAVAMTLMVTGCVTLETPNGQIPEQYLGVARRIEGTYSGTIRSPRAAGFSQRDAELTIRLDGARVVVSSSEDFAGSSCQSQIGQLESVDVSDDGSAVERAEFAFNPNFCSDWIHGRKLVLSIARDKSGKISISTWIRVRTIPGHGGRGGRPSRQVVITGRFK